MGEQKNLLLAIVLSIAIIVIFQIFFPQQTMIMSEQEIVQKSNHDVFFDQVCLEVSNQMKNHSENNVPIEVILFDFDGDILSRYPKQ